MIDKKNIVALVTLYNPEQSVYENIYNLSMQVAYIVLLDNSNTNNGSLFTNINNAIYIPNNCNLGLSAAFNKAFSLEVVRKSDYIIFFDQDSRIPDAFIIHLINDYENSKGKLNAGCISPQYYDTNSNKIINPRSKSEILHGIYTVNTTITSSMLTTYSVMKDIGFWNEDVFLDMADWDICWRMAKYGYKILLDTNLTLTHTLGKGIKQVLFFKLRLNNPIREYYQIRDSIKLSRKDYIPFKYRIRFFLMWFVMPLVYILFCPEKKKRANLVIKAFKDGLQSL